MRWAGSLIVMPTKVRRRGKVGMKGKIFSIEGEQRRGWKRSCATFKCQLRLKSAVFAHSSMSLGNKGRKGQ